VDKFKKAGIKPTFLIGDITHFEVYEVINYKNYECEF